MNAIPPTRAWAEFIAGLKQVTNGKPVLRNRLAAMKTAPMIYWYPGCGTDLSPLILDVPNNPTGQRLYRINAAAADQSAPIVLWMNDYSTHQDGFLRAIKPFSPARFRIQNLNNHNKINKLGER